MSTFTWTKCNGTNELTLRYGSPTPVQAGGALVGTGNIMIDHQLDSITWEYNRRGTSGANSHFVNVKVYDSDGTLLATSDSGDNLLVSEITTDTDYNNATEHTFNFSTPATLTEDSYILTETDMVNDPGGSPEVWTSTSNCTANTNLIEYKNTNSPPLDNITTKDMVGSAEYSVPAPPAADNITFPQIPKSNSIENSAFKS